MLPLFFVNNITGFLYKAEKDRGLILVGKKPVNFIHFEEYLFFKNIYIYTIVSY